MWKPVRVVSANFLKRISEPASPFYSDFLAYRNGEITQADLIARLPHIASIGDSVCTGVYVSSIWGTVWRARTCRGNNWFLDSNPPPAAGEPFATTEPAFPRQFRARDASADWRGPHAASTDRNRRVWTR